MCARQGLEHWALLIESTERGVSAVASPQEPGRLHDLSALWSGAGRFGDCKSGPRGGRVRTVDGESGSRRSVWVRCSVGLAPALPSSVPYAYIYSLRWSFSVGLTLRLMRLVPLPYGHSSHTPMTADSHVPGPLTKSSLCPRAPFSRALSREGRIQKLVPRACSVR